MDAASVIGEDLIGMGFRLDPWPVWERLRHDHPVFWNETTKQWVITRYDDVCTVFADNDHFSNSIYAQSLGVVFGRTMLQLDGAEHVSLRKIVSPELVGNNLGRYLDVIRRESSVLIDAFPGGARGCIHQPHARQRDRRHARHARRRPRPLP